ncbi:MAG: DNA polymerase I [Candidatus Omnitrophica bacterium]|nr:DNA polymerase I [Candidatus Omnitrophota bacterium]MBU4589710.1 DNA polymerase I [Candidatus Omnitrophota bacterium]
MKKKKLFLIDGNSYCYRAFYAIKELRNSKGLPTNAVYGFILMLKKIMASERPDYLAVAFDVKAPTFRHEKFKGYKIKRKPMPDDLVSQMPLIKDMVLAHNIPVFEKEGYEADDVLATIAKEASKKGLDVYIVTGDKDILQFVDDNIKIYSTHKEGLVYDREKVRERFSGLGPESIVDLMALAGDATDNIPGVRGIGEKTAIELVREFGDIENLYKNLNRVKSEARKKLLANEEESARMSKELAMIDASVPIKIDIESMRVAEPDSKKLLEIFKELEFKSFAKEISSSDSGVRREAKYETIRDKKRFDEFVKNLNKQKEFVLDFETTGGNPLEARPLGVSFCWKAGEAYYVSFKGIDLKYAFRELKSILEDEKIKKIGQNIKYEKLILYNYGIELKGISFDTMVAAYLLNPSKLNNNLDDLAFEYLSHKMISMEDLLGTGKKKITMEEVSVEELSEYSCEDSDVTFRLKEILEQALFEKEMDRLFKDIELPLIDVLSDIERNGVKIDEGLLKKASRDAEKELSRIVTKIYDMAGGEFNINSPKQLSEILFDRLGLPVIKKTKTGRSTDMGVLERLSSVHPLPKELLRYRELSKLKSTYIDALPELVNPKTGRVHTSFNQTVTATGRLSSSKPNLQNIPVKTAEGREIRRAFIGEGDRYIMSADYSQIELRILAHLSGDEELIQAFEKGIDVHTHTASLIFNVDEKDVTPEMRANAKTVNFGIVYGISAFGLSRGLSIDPQSAQDFIDSYFERYPRVKMYMEDKIEEAKDAGYVTTLFNRRRYIPEITTGAMREQQQAERIAINTPVQGSAADLIKIAMINIHEEMKKKKLDSMMIMQVHDELVFEVPEKELEEMARLVKAKMEGAVKLKVPVEVTVKHGKTWLGTEKS